MDVYFKQQIDNSRVVRSDDPRQRREQSAVMGAVALLFLLCFGYAWQRYAVVQMGYRMEAARQQAANLTDWNRGLRLQQASLLNPTRIYTLAQDQGMESPQPGQILALDTLPTLSTPAPALAMAQTPRGLALDSNLGNQP